MYSQEYVDLLESKLEKLEDMVHEMQVKIYKLEEEIDNNNSY